MAVGNQLHLGLLGTEIQVSAFWRELTYVEKTASTNDVAKARALEGAPEGTIVVAEEQTAGRGRLDRRWLAPPRTSLLFSLLFRPALEIAQAGRLTMVCSMAAADGIAQTTELGVALKWPNDLIVHSTVGVSDPDKTEWRKLGGVLTESSVANGDLDFVVVGIGINVNVPRGDLEALDPKATSILAEAGQRIERTKLLVAVLRAVDARYRSLRRGDDPHGEWSRRLATLGQRVRVTTPDGTPTGVAEGVDEDGALLLRRDDGSLRRLLAGDVSLSEE